MQNKKWLKKTAAMLLAGTLMCGAGAVAWTGSTFTAAAETTIGQTPTSGSLTIHKTDGESQPLKGAEFSVYKVMSLTPGATAGEFAKYEPVMAFAETLKSVTPDALGNYSAQQLDNLAVSLAGVASGHTADGTQTTGQDGSAVFANLPLGYYLVVETGVPEGGYVAGRPFLIAIPSTDNYNDPTAPGTTWVYDVEASPKNTKTSLDKEIDKAATGEDLSTDGSVKVGDYVPYKISTTVPDYSDASYENADVTFTITDVMSDGLEIQTAEGYPVTVKVNGTAVAAGAETYTLTAVPAAGENPDLTVAFVSAYTKAHPKEAVEITYYAKVTDAAVMGTGGNLNEAELTFSNNPGGDTTTVPGPEIKVYSFGLDLVKFTNEATDKPLAGAEFTLYAAKADGTMDETKELGSGTTGADGKIVVTGNPAGKEAYFRLLDEGTYYLKEEKAPEGYTLLANPIKVKIEAVKTDGLATGQFKLYVNDEEVSVTTGDYNAKIDVANGLSTVAVENHKGFSLPATGGMGIVLFLVIGVAGIIAVSILMTRKTKEN